MRQSQVSNQKIRVQTLLKRQGFLRSRMAHELQYASCRMNDKKQHIQLLTMQIQDLIASKSEAEKQITELISLNQKLISQAAKKDAIVAELTSAKEKEAHIEKMTLELSKITQELVLHNVEKEARAAELQIANVELAFQNSEKDKRGKELSIAHEKLMVVNEELIFQNSEKEKQAEKLVLSYEKNTLLNHQMNQMQKLESIGRLTSGIAHDFNNILMCILGYNEINKMDSEDIDDELLRISVENNVKQIDLAGKRAAELINKMLTYCRQDAIKQKIEVCPTTEVIHEVVGMLRPALTSRIQLETVLACDEIIIMDVIDLHQILTNLAVNARDAMKERGGEITISLKTVTNMKKIYCVACAEPASGDFIELSVSDNGTGIDPKIIGRLFDPFFTTKPQGEGTGLGLSSVSGLVHQAGGHLLVETNQSEHDHGTAFKLLFPLPPELNCMEIISQLRQKTPDGVR